MKFRYALFGLLMSFGATIGLVSQAAAVTYLGDIGTDPFPAGGEFRGSPGLAKCDTETDGGPYPLVCTTWKDGGATGDYSNAFRLTYGSDVGGQVNFSWSFDAANPTLLASTSTVLLPRYIVVKQSTSVFAWELEAADDKTTGFIQTVFGDISHVSFFDGAGSISNPPPSVPLPASALFLIAGLGGIVAFRRSSKTA